MTELRAGQVWRISHPKSTRVEGYVDWELIAPYENKQGLYDNDRMWKARVVEATMNVSNVRVGEIGNICPEPRKGDTRLWTQVFWHEAKL